MEVAAAAGSSPTGRTGATGAKSRAQLDYDAFLQLLIAQMKNQDPTQPMESTEYIAQLAAFSNVEQAVQTNAKLDSLMAALSLSQADGVIGRTVSSADSDISGKVTALRVAEGGTVLILDNGQELPFGPGITIT
jgi:flagellar basal-body rod modification protein FlgD